MLDDTTPGTISVCACGGSTDCAHWAESGVRRHGQRGSKSCARLRQCQNTRLGVRVFRPVRRSQRYLGLYQTPVTLDNPSANEEGLTGGDMTSKTNPEFSGEGLAACCCHSVEHHLIEDRAHHAWVGVQVAVTSPLCCG